MQIAGPDVITTLIHIDAVDIENNVIQVRLLPTSIQDVLTVRVHQVSGWYNEVYYNVVGGGQYSISMAVNNLASGSYGYATAYWGGAAVARDVQRPFTLVGHFRQSTYNVPSESSCSATQGNAWFVTHPGCNYSGPFSLSVQFLEQVAVNGTGLSNNYGYIQTENAHPPAQRCIDPNHYDGPGPGNGNANVRDYHQVPTVTGTCGTPLGNTTVARHPTNMPAAGFACGTEVFIIGGAHETTGQPYPGTYKTVADAGGGLSGYQLDNFSTTPSCSPLQSNWYNTAVITFP